MSTIKPKKDSSSRIIKMKETMMQRYGVDNPMKLKSIREKVKATNLKKYGNACSLHGEEIKEKVKKTNIKKYGTEHSSQNVKVKQKTKETNLKRYGNSCSLHGEEIKEKVKRTCLDRYGCEYATQSEQMKTKTKDTTQRKYGVEYTAKVPQFTKKRKVAAVKSQAKYLFENVFSDPNNTVIPLFTEKEYKGGAYDQLYKWKCLECDHEFEYYYHSKLPICRNCHPKSVSKGQEALITYIKDTFPHLTIEVNTRKIIKPYELDIYLPEINFAIEYNGEYWHSMYEEGYHELKAKLCKDNNITLLNVWEDNEWKKDPDQVKEIIKTTISTCIKNIKQ